jgi:hypothetical protein
MASWVKRFKSWSISRLRDWEGCAFAAKLKHLDKLPVPGSKAMERGSAIGKMCEDYVTGELLELPEELELFGPEFLELRDAYRVEGGKTIFVEETWGFDKDWTPCAWDDWDRCWVRVKMDLGRFVASDHILNVDYKTGRFKQEMAAFDYVPQLNLYGTGALCRYPAVEKVSARLAYLDSGLRRPLP